MARLKSFNIDANTLADWILSTGMTPKEISEIIGREESYLTSVLKKGRIGFTPYKMLLRTFNLPDGSFLPKPEMPVCQEVIIEAEPERKGYSLDMQVFPEKLRLALLFNGLEIKYCYVKILGDTELDLMQAISYAAHMLYKYAQSDTLEYSSQNADK